MTPTRQLVSFAVVAMLVWSVAFGGGYTVALFTANATVSGTFEAADEFSPIDVETDESETTLGGDTVPENATNGYVASGNVSLVGNGSAGNGTDSDGNVTDPDDNGTDSEGNVTDANGNVTDSDTSEPALAGAFGDTDDSEDESDPEIDSTDDGESVAEDEGVEDDEGTAEDDAGTADDVDDDTDEAGASSDSGEA